jgi:site-specific DNA recombinase
LTNERYIGDAVFQKTYKTTTLPYMKKINHGEYEKYYVSGINDAIVDKLDFEKVRELLAIRG